MIYICESIFLYIGFIIYGRNMRGMRANSAVI